MAIGGAVRSKVVTFTVPTIANETIATAGLEQSYALPSSTKFLLLRNRDAGLLKYSYTATESGTNYRSLYQDESLIIEGLSGDSPVTIYFQSPKVGGVVEIESWA